MEVGIIGATGYSGLELIRLLKNHPQVTNIMLYSSSQSGETINRLYPHLQNEQWKPLKEIDLNKISAEIDVMFLATPPGVSAEWSGPLLEAGLSVIDLSGDLRLTDRGVYEKWYKRPSAKEGLIEQAIYGLSEWNKSTIKTAKLIANPGCFPTAALLALIPLIQAGAIERDSIVIDAKSGTSGAGKSPTSMTHFSETNENFKIYQVASHKHTPEIEQQLAKWGAQPPLSFQPHLVPMVRGIMATIYAKAAKPLSNEWLTDCYNSAYENAPFVRIKENGTFPATKHVFGSNYCDIGFCYDKRTGRVIVASVIDNLMKGAAGQAVQNFNLMHGFDETAGLEAVPMYP